MQVFPNFTCFLAPSGLRPTMQRTTVVQAILYQCLVLHPYEQCTVAAVRIAGSRSVHPCSDLFLAVRRHLTPPVDHRLGLCLSPSSVGCCFRPSSQADCGTHECCSAHTSDRPGPRRVVAPVQAVHHNHLSAPGACSLSQLPVTAFSTTLLDAGRSADQQVRAATCGSWQHCVQASLTDSP